MPARTPVPSRLQRDATVYPSEYARLAARHAEREAYLTAQQARQDAERAAERRALLNKAYDSQARQSALSSLLSARATAAMAVRCGHDMIAALCVDCAPLLTVPDDVTPATHADTLASDTYAPSKRTRSQRPATRNAAQTMPAPRPARGNTTVHGSRVTMPQGTLKRSDPLSRDGWQGDQSVTVSVAQHVPTASDLAYLARSTADLYRTTKSRRRRYRRAMIDAETRARAASAALDIVRDEATIEVVTRPATQAEVAARHAARSLRDQASHPDPRTIVIVVTPDVPVETDPTLTERAQASQAQARAIRDSIRASAHTAQASATGTATVS